MNRRTWRKFWSQILKLKLQIPLGISIVLAAPPAFGAEMITISYGLLEVSVSVVSLETYAQTGHVESDLANCAQYIGSNYLEQLRQMLRTRIDLSAVEISQLLYSTFGESSLQYLGEAIQTDSHLNGFFALRAALILAATDSEGLTLLNVVKKFPTPTIRINSPVAIEMLGAFTNLAHVTDQAVALVGRQAASEAETEVAADASHPINLQQTGISKWQKQVLTIHDSQRRRTLITDLYLPQQSTPAPILVISHGLTADRSNFAHLAKHLASHGFAVAVVEHPGSNKQHFEELLAGMVSEVVEPDEFINRPLDISYLLNQLTQLNQTDPALTDRLNLEQIGMIGHSFGGYTALALAGAEPNLPYLQSICQNDNIDINASNLSLLLQCTALKLPPETNWRLQDQRIRAVFAIHPISSAIFGKASLGRIQVPVILVAGSRDMIAPAVLEQICPFTWLTGAEKHLALVEQGTHAYSTSELNSALPLASVGPAPAIARNYLKALTLAFAQSYIAEQPEFRSYLTASYAQFISQSTLPLRMIQTLTASQLSELNFTCPEAQSAQKL